MALDTDDYILILNSMIDIIALEEQKKSQQLISEKLEQLNMITFKCDAEKQKTFTLIISSLKRAKKKILVKAEFIDNGFKDTWILLSTKLDEQITLIQKEKARHARSHV
jgi:hypothetical protein